MADQNEDTIYSDLAGRFPVCSYSGMNYIFVAYVYKINAILVRPMSTRFDETIIAQVGNISPPEQLCTAIYDDMFCFAILADQK